VTRAFAIIRMRCFTWSNASTVSNSMNPASSSAASALPSVPQTARVHASARAGSNTGDAS
jgi:hypothetical protein